MLLKQQTQYARALNTIYFDFFGYLGTTKVHTRQDRTSNVNDDEISDNYPTNQVPFRGLVFGKHPKIAMSFKLKYYFLKQDKCFGRYDVTFS